MDDDPTDPMPVAAQFDENRPHRNEKLLAVITGSAVAIVIAAIVGLVFTFRGSNNIDPHQSAVGSEPVTAQNADLSEAQDSGLPSDLQIPGPTSPAEVDEAAQQSLGDASAPAPDALTPTASEPVGQQSASETGLPPAQNGHARPCGDVRYRGQNGSRISGLSGLLLTDIVAKVFLE